MARVAVAMSGGVDSSVAAARLVARGHDVTGVTLRLWGGETDSGCCAVSDVEDARRVAAQLGVPHYVFNLADDFEAEVVAPYVAAYAAGLTPNPCVACNRRIKWGRLRERAVALGFDALATGHHARVEVGDGRVRLRRGADRAKDQSYVLARLGCRELSHTLLPVGDLTKAEVRAEAEALGLRTAAKPDSMDVCFVARGDRVGFLDRRVAPVAGRVVDVDGRVLGSHDGVRRFTVGQRRALGLGGGERRYVVDVDAATATVTVGARADLLRDDVELRDVGWVEGEPPRDPRVEVQTSAHGRPVAGHVDGDRVRFDRPQPRVAPDQVVALYRGDVVLGAGLAR